MQVREQQPRAAVGRASGLAGTCGGADQGVFAGVASGLDSPTSGPGAGLAMPFNFQTSLPRALGAATMPSMRTVMSTISLTLAVGCGGSTAASPSDGGGQSDGTSQDIGSQTDTGRPGSDGSSDTSVGTDAGQDDAQDDSGPWSPVCPATAPAAGTACQGAQYGLYCEYGNAWWSVTCDVVMHCVPGSSSGSWSVAYPGGTGCSGQPGPNPPACPANGPNISGDSPDAGLTCHYNQGDICWCQNLFNGDAGVYWDCFPNTPACGYTRPRLGAPCTVNGLGCIYDLCSYAQECGGGIWYPVPQSCQ